MNSTNISLLAVRLMVLYLFLTWLSSVGVTVYNFVLWRQDEIIGGWHQFIFPLSYLVILLLLFRFSTPIAKKVAKGLEEIEPQSTGNETQLLATLIAALCMFVVLSAIPTLIDQLYGLLNYSRNVAMFLNEKERLNNLVLGFVSSSVQVGVALVCYLRAKPIAELWHKWQSPRRLTSGSS